MSIVDKNYIFSHITNNQSIDKDRTTFLPVPYRWTHGATEYHIGDGLIIYSIIQMMKYKVCVCLGSGGGFIPRIMTQARVDLHDQGIFEGNPDKNWGDIGVTYLVDAANGVGGEVNYLEETSFYRHIFRPRFINETTENAYYNFFVKQDIKIDFLHIDAGHSYEDVKRDFELYSKLLNPNGMISIHDTDANYQKEYIVTEDEKKDFVSFDGPSKFVSEKLEGWTKFNFFNSSQLRDKPSSTGVTLLQRV